MSSADPLPQVQTLLSAGRIAEAAAALIDASDKGHADALFTLATWRISGQIMRRDTAAARELMGKAADAGHGEAALLHANFLANGTGGRADWQRARELVEQIAGRSAAAAEQLAMLAKMAVTEDGNPDSEVVLRMVSQSPRVQSCPGFLTQEECAYLCRKAEPRLQPSLVTDRQTGRSFPNPVRRSESTFFGAAYEDLVISAINRRIAAASATQIEQAEPLQVLRYRTGDEFRPHLDSVKTGGNQRILTAIIYLSDGYTGGETRFVRTGLCYRGALGDLLLFSNVTPDGQPDLLAEHAGLPVLSGIKVVASRWIWRDPPIVSPPNPLLADF